MNKQLSKVLDALDQAEIDHEYGMPHADYITVLASPNPNDRLEITVWYDGEVLVQVFARQQVDKANDLDTVLAMIADPRQRRR